MAIALDPENHSSYTNRGLVKWELKDQSGACRDWKNGFQRGSEQAQQLLQKHCR
jgi:hypothetical protein